MSSLNVTLVSLFLIATGAALLGIDVLTMRPMSFSVIYQPSVRSLPTAWNEQLPTEWCIAIRWICRLFGACCLIAGVLAPLVQGMRSEENRIARMGPFHGTDRA